MPDLSICIPTFNRSSLLNRLLKCIHHQLDPNKQSIEIVISDNASTDDTEITATTWQHLLPIKYIRNPHNIGSLENTKSSLKEASGSYALVCGDDDHRNLSEVYEILDYLELNQHISVAFTPWIQRTSDGTEIPFFKLPNDIIINAGDQAKLLSTILEFNIFPEIYIGKTSILNRYRVNNKSPIVFSFFSAISDICKNHNIVFINKIYFYQNIHPSIKSNSQLSNNGHMDAISNWEIYRGGLEYIRSNIDERNNAQISTAISNFIDQFIAIRMLVALKLRLNTGFGSLEDCFYLAKRITGLGLENLLPFELESLREMALIDYLIKTYEYHSFFEIFLQSKVDRSLISMLRNFHDGLSLSCDGYERIERLEVSRAIDSESDQGKALIHTKNLDIEL